ncbi:polysaccharide biosynthesis protein [Pseudoxanthomonas winnipegensis]|uniref:rhamnan synthesis F family protein n=1 Tax=Pseudoxanthomonas winnipegensis TaxID=2480810 RepID=UPI002575496E|nr:rhamnan synthesis F family protein [Pseudoxanthomonas winnipegensis]WJI16287.1 polysaccharide biosynthesis protein [Pseudoxanthomonas winnipegensis]
MLRHLTSAQRTVRGLVARHGGGWKGLLTVLQRAWQLARALGLRGLMRRFRSAGQTLQHTAPPAGFRFPEALPLEGSDLRVGIMAHVYYADLIDELASYLQQMPIRYTLMVSVVDEQTAARCRISFSALANLEALHVQQVPNRGRDIAPFFVHFGQQIATFDVVAHVHTKKSLYTGSEQSNWRTYLLDRLLGDRARIAWVLGMFLAEPKLGIVYPESYPGVPLWAHTWLGNVQAGQSLAASMGISIEPQRYFDFPAGSMFWARVDALRPLLDLELALSDFPEEQGQTDGTTQHAIERLLVLTARSAGFIAGILPGDGTQTLSDEGARNWRSYFQEPMQTRITVAALQARLVSVDLFDTLATRPFLYPSGARAYLGELIRNAHGISDFAALRQQAEQRARAHNGGDVDLAQIYAAMSALPAGPSAQTAAALMDMELECEARLLRPRDEVLRSISNLRRSVGRIIAVSDMYLTAAQLQRALPDAVWRLTDHCYVSCQTQQRKDDGSAWDALPALESTPATQWLHVGDNERSDVQLPQDRGYLTPVHVLRADALLDVVPALRSLRPSLGTETSWPDQLLLGLLTRSLADLADREPHRFGDALALPDPYTLGYLVLGPLLVDYSAWLGRIARETGTAQILFLAREGHLLERAFGAAQQAARLADPVATHYLLASRRGVGTPSLREPADLDALLGNTFNGTLEQLLQSRLGKEAVSAVQAVLGQHALQAPVYLPDMRATLAARLAPAMAALLAIAEIERKDYLAYWHTVTAEGPLLLADIGYSGTIQKLLGRVTGRPIDAAYFAVNARIDELDATAQRAWARYEDARAPAAAPSPVSRHDLLLETLLTAPQGQFLRFRRDAEGLKSEHAAHELRDQDLALLEQVHSGAMAFVRDLAEVAGPFLFELTFDPALVQAPLACLGAGQWRAGAWLEALQVEDAYTGRGAITVQAQLAPR